MVASGVASKGLDFNDIQHVIIFSMPKEIEDYVHQIGRTGRSGKTGIATTFVNMNTPEQTLLDLKYLLMEAGQKYVLRLEDVLPILMLLLGFHRSCRASMIHELLKEAPSKGALSAEVRLAVATLSRTLLTDSARSRARYTKLSEVGRYAKKADGIPPRCRRSGWWLLKSALVAGSFRSTPEAPRYVYLGEQCTILCWGYIVRVYCFWCSPFLASR